MACRCGTCGREARLDVQALRDALSARWSPHQVVQMVVQWLRQHFADPANILIEEIRNLVWREGLNSSLPIDAAARFKPQNAMQRPAIYVRRGECAPAERTLGNNSLMGGCSKCGGRNHQVTYTCPIVCFCVGGESAEDELLADEVVSELSGFALDVAIALDGLVRITLPSYGAPVLLPESTETFAVPVTFSVSYRREWRSRSLSTSPARRVVLNS